MRERVRERWQRERGNRERREIETNQEDGGGGDYRESRERERGERQRQSERDRERKKMAAFLTFSSLIIFLIDSVSSVLMPESLQMEYPPSWRLSLAASCIL